MTGHVAVLKGGWSAEREVSLSSGAACAAALARAGFRVTEIDLGPKADGGRDLAARLTGVGPDVVFNALHGPFGEDGSVQGLLELMGLPYTHSGIRASAIAMDKPTAKVLFAARGIPVAEGVVATVEVVARGHVLPPPYVVKPTNEGSSVGVHIVRPGDNRYPAGLADHWPLGKLVLVERFVPGRELTVAVMDGRALAVTDILPQGGEFYDYEAKYANGGSRHVIQAGIPEAVMARAMAIAEQAHAALGCRGVSRSDLRWNDEWGENGLCLLEVNTQPGMTPTSLVPEQAAYCGMSFEQLVTWMVEDASCDR